MDIKEDLNMDIKELKITEKKIICQLSKLGNLKKKDKETFKKVEKLKQTLKDVKIAYANLKEELSKGFVLFDMPRIFQFDHIFFTEEEIRVRYHNKKTNALNRKLDFSLSFETFKSLMSQKECFYTKQKYSFSDDISIDRLDNYKGYVEGNVVSCHVSINQLKDDFSFEEIKACKKFFPAPNLLTLSSIKKIRLSNLAYFLIIFTVLSDEPSS